MGWSVSRGGVCQGGGSLPRGVVAATAQTRPSIGVPVAGLGGYQVGERPIVLRQLLLW